MEPAATSTKDLNVFELSREVLDELPFGVITLDRCGTVLRFNREQAALARREAVQTVGLSFFNDVAPCTNVQTFRGRFDAFAAQHDSGVEHFEFSFAFRWGRHDVSITLLRKAGHEDINILVRGESMARATQAQSPEPSGPSAFPLQFHGAILPAAFDTKELARPLIGPLDADYRQALAQRVHPDDFATVRAVVEAAERERTSYAVEYRGRGDRPDRRIYQEHGYFDPDHGRPSHATIIDISEQRTVELEAWRAAHVDLLTGLPNRALLLLRVADAIREAEQNSRIAALLLVNINGFRTINDTDGYPAGDAVLRAVSLRLGECVRGGDTIARLIGDYFAVLLTDVDARQSVAATARRLMAAIADPIVVADRPYYLTLRIGVSLAPYDGTDPTLLLRAAETALHAARADGHNGLRFFSGQIASDALRNSAEQNELRAALENDEFTLLYQPLVDIETDRIVATEALVRWNHPTRGVVSPVEFIPLADRTGLIVPLGSWVLRTACRQARRWADAGFDVRVCVNVSTVQFQRPDFVDLVTALVSEFGLAPRRLELEVTESIMVEGFAQMMETLARLKTLGVRLAIDDFGTGYSSLSYLKYLPVDTLKIDRAFVIDIVSDAFDQAIATAVLTLTRKLALECVVEGVETPEQLAKLRELGCTIVQGYYFSKPVQAQTIDTMLGLPMTKAAT